MAKATKNIPQKPVITYTLELTEEEANFLLAVTQCIGGDPVASRRRYSDTIAEALKNAGIPHLVTDERLRIPDIMKSNSSIWFHDEVK